MVFQFSFVVIYFETWRWNLREKERNQNEKERKGMMVKNTYRHVHWRGSCDDCPWAMITNDKKSLLVTLT